MKFEKVVALVPMRHHSQRVPQKNFRDLAGKPLYMHILSSLAKCKLIHAIVVDTDSPTIQEGIKEHYPQITVLDRPQHLRADDVPMNEILFYDTEQIPADLYLQTHSTNPLLLTETITQAIQDFSDVYPAYDSLFSVTRLQTRLWDELARPINHNPAILLQTQDLPPVYEENSCLYLFTREGLLRKRTRIGDRPYLFEISALEAQDIDEEQDFLIADLLMKYRMRNELL
ncbi:MAG: acylneuraminate cytidylyltransferase family protein [Pelolinea sp.]|jgi:CMP-N-acetylneuraminic acid synthetase|nr:acylneuraminate cytidylyltransferase family protein [Pelolinea sp.]